MRSSISPPYAHLPTSISTTPGTDPTATTTTRYMPPIGSRVVLDDSVYLKDHLGWLVVGHVHTNANVDTDTHYADVMTALRLDGWRADHQRNPGDICLGTTWLRPPRPDDTYPFVVLHHA